MRQSPGATDDLTVDWGETGATLGVRVLNGATTITARQTGFVESPAGSGRYVLADYEFPTSSGTYELLFDDDGGTAAEGHIAIEELIITTGASSGFASGATDDLTIDWGDTGATLGVRVMDGTTTITARQTGFVESPAGSGRYVLADYEFPDTPGTYELLFDDDGGTAAEGHVATEELIIVGGAYGTTDELFRILKIRTPTTEQTNAAERVLAAATGEINSEVDLPDPDVLSGWQVSLATEVCLERAAELWKEQEVQFGLVGIGSEFGATRIAINTWEKYAVKLAPLKQQWGFS